MRRPLCRVDDLAGSLILGPAQVDLFMSGTRHFIKPTFARMENVMMFSKYALDFNLSLQLQILTNFKRHRRHKQQRISKDAVM